MAVYTPFLAGQTLTAGALNSLLAQETMPWTALSTIGSFGTGFSAGAPTPRMHKIVFLGTEIWEFEGRLNVSGLTANSNVVAFTFNTGYRVTSERGAQIVAANSAFYGARLTFEANGQMMLGVPTAAGSGVSGVILDEIRITNPFA